MSRRPRFPVTGHPLHVVQRGNDRQPCFFAEADYRFYLDSLGDAAQHYAVQVHAYVLMANHIHLLVTPLAAGAVSRRMQSLGARNVGHVYARWCRTGTLWEGRYKACLVDHDRHPRLRGAHRPARGGAVLRIAAVGVLEIVSPRQFWEILRVGSEL
jgi:putative transposase